MNTFPSSRLRAESILSIALLTLTVVLTYGVLIPRLGFYHDDWYLIWSGETQGLDGIRALFTTDRPFLGILYAFDYAILGASPLGWHIYALTLRLAGVLAFFWLLRLLWPDRRVETTFIALLFAIYPGFYQQPNAATFKMILLAYASGIFSIALTIRAVQSPRRIAQFPLTAAAFVFGLLYLAIYESMIGLEAVRLTLLWYILQKETPSRKESAVRTFKRFLPYLLMSLAFVFWRVAIFKGERRSVNMDVLFGRYASDPVRGLLTVVSEFLKDLIESAFYAWAVPLYQFTANVRYRDLIVGALLALLVTGLAAAYLYWMKRRGAAPGEDPAAARAGLPLVTLGAAFIALTMLPVNLAGRNVLFAIQFDRYTFQTALGVALFLGGLAFYAMRPSLRYAFLGGLLAIGVMTHYHSAAWYRDFWTIQRGMWWQLSWRAPDLQAGAAVIAAAPGKFALSEDYEVWGPLNLAYNHGGPLKVSGQIVFADIIVDLQRATFQQTYNRTIYMERDYGRPLIVSMPSEDSCLHVLDGRALELPLIENPSVAMIAPFSRIELILTGADPVQPPLEILGPEPPHDWCYYYQKIGLARQRGDWAQAARLAEEASARGLSPADRSEWIPVFQAYFESGQTQKAREVIKYIKTDRRLWNYLCSQAAPLSPSSEFLCAKDN